MVRGYTPVLVGLAQFPVAKDRVTAHQEQVEKRALIPMSDTPDPHVLKKDVLPRDAAVYCFKRGNKFCRWHKGFVRSKPHTVLLSSSLQYRGASIRAALEDFRKAPQSSLL